MAIKVEIFSTNSCPHCPAAIDAAQQAKVKLGDAIDVESIKIDESVSPVTNEYKQNSIFAVRACILCIPADNQIHTPISTSASIQ